MKKTLLFALLLIGSISARAQFSPGQILTAAALNGQFALYLPLTGGTLTGPVSLASGATITSYNGTSTAGNGLPVLVAKYDTATPQSANVPTSTVFYSVPASGAGSYWIRPYVVVMQAATTSSTMPQIQCAYVDKDTGVSENVFLGTTSTANTVGTLTQSSGATMNVQASTNITCGTSGYASSGATPMQFMVHLKLLYMGS